MTWVATRLRVGWGQGQQCGVRHSSGFLYWNALTIGGPHRASDIKDHSLLGLHSEFPIYSQLKQFVGGHKFELFAAIQKLLVEGLRS